MEIWKDIPGYESLYQVSNYGRVKSCERIVIGPYGANKTLKERIRKPVIVGGYKKVDLYQDGKGKMFSVHRLVMYAFVGIQDDMVVNHKDENKLNNHFSNLEYITHGDNTRAWNKNNPERRAEIENKRLKNAISSTSKKVIDTSTGKSFYSIREASRYMYECEKAKRTDTWLFKIIKNKQNRFILI